MCTCMHVFIRYIHGCDICTRMCASMHTLCSANMYNTRMHECMNARMHTCMYIHLHANVCARTHARMHAPMYALMYVYTYVCMHVCTHKYTQVLSSIYMHKYTTVYVYVQGCSLSLSLYIYIYIYIYICKRICEFTQAYLQTAVCIQVKSDHNLGHASLCALNAADDELAEQVVPVCGGPLSFVYTDINLCLEVLKRGELIRFPV